MDEQRGDSQEQLHKIEFFTCIQASEAAGIRQKLFKTKHYWTLTFHFFKKTPEKNWKLKREILSQLFPSAVLLAEGMAEHDRWLCSGKKVW